MFPAFAQEMCDHLGPSVAGEHAFEVHPGGAAGALSGLEIGEVPHVHPDHERSLRRDIEVATDELDLVILHPHFGRHIVRSGKGICAELGDDHGLAEPLVQRVQFACQRLSPQGQCTL